MNPIPLTDELFKKPIKFCKTQKSGEFLKYFVSSPYLSLKIPPVLAVKPYLRGNT